MCDEPSPAGPPSSNGGVDRDAERASVAIVCEVRVGGRDWQKARLVDLSTSGFRLTWAPDCSVGGRIWVRFGTLAPLSADVCWKEGSTTGCRFSAPLSPYVFDHIVRTNGR